MIRLYCTKKLADLLPAKLAKDSEEREPFYSWYANVITYQRKKVVVACCGDGRFGFVLWGVKKKQLDDLPSVFMDGIRATFAYYHFKPELIERYLASDEPLAVYAASNRKGIAGLNKVIQFIENLRFNTLPDELLPFYVVRAMNRDFIPYGQREHHSYPIDIMVELFRKRFGETPISQPAFVIEAAMDLERYTARRTLVVPSASTFSALHRYLQIAFDWENYHAHEFIIPREGGKEYIVCTDEDADMPGETYALDHEVSLAEKLKKRTRFTYLYDFGDGWEIDLKVVDYLENYDRIDPCCTVCEGAAPPEDVGGVWGYLDFLDAMSDPNHPEHDEMKEWVGYRWHMEPNQRSINYSLQR